MRRPPLPLRPKVPSKRSKIGYHRKTNSLVIEFRRPGTKKNGKMVATGLPPWVLYYDVEPDMWESLCASGSTGRWLKSSGVEMGNYDRLGSPNKTFLAKMIENYHGMSVEDLSASENLL
jgi:hypothetical protein